jgi:CRP/FNR family transcriptional regulator, anaerobic regulatory protein
MLSHFVEQLNQIFALSPNLRKAIEEDTEVKVYEKGALLLKEGECSNHVTAVLSGLLRSYYLKDGYDISSRFTPAGEVVLSVNSFYSRKPGYEFISAMEETTVARINYEQMQYYLQNYLEFNYIVRVFTEKYYAASEEHLFNLRKQSAEEKWNYFLDRYPHLVQTVALKHIASFLGMNTETLSRVRALK